MEKIGILATTITLLVVGANGWGIGCLGQKCCGDLGCFSLGYPWCSITRPIPPPKCQDHCSVKFFFFSERDSSTIVSGWPVANLNNTGFDPKKKTVFLIHGWRYIQKQFPYMKRIIDAYFECFNVNIIFVDFSSCSRDRYLQNVSSIRVIAAQVVRLIKWLIREHGLTPDKLHIIGHSLGAQIAGYIGKSIQDTHWITGLDAAKPLFDLAPPEVQLGKLDATYVELLHTSTLIFGVPHPKGHVDYYMNDHISQPSCDIAMVEDIVHEGILSEDFIPDVINYTSCAHALSIDYYAAALRGYCNNCTMWGETYDIVARSFNFITRGMWAENITVYEECELSTCSPIGPKSEKYPARGTFLVATNIEEPYCIPHPEVDTMMKQKLQNFEKRANRTDASGT